MLTLLLPLCAFAFLAGFMDSIVGGGGLIQLPALFILLPHAAVPTILGTNKLVSITGTSVAATQYAKHVRIKWRVILPAALAAFVFSGLGARVVSHIHAAALRPLVLVLLLAVAAHVFFQKDFGSRHVPKLTEEQQRWVGIVAGIALGFYDGFFGPGTGSFLIFTFVGLFGLSFLSASASAKVINAATNLAAVIYFALTSHLFYTLALPMAVCNIGGSLVGTRLAIVKGSQFVRTTFLVVIAGIIARFAYDTFR